MASVWRLQTLAANGKYFTPTRESTPNNQSSSLSTPSSKCFSAFTGTPVLNLLQPVERNLLTSSKKPRNRSTYPSKSRSQHKKFELSQTEADLHPMDRANSVNSRESRV
ncbi:uncharacterized protein M6B38_142585 [Iris pallida]|uniref:Uncharacterized protein n=1 Tax=Iris pallida TaxID=29817 RepID=A0AAX6FCI7_IRIPA|nr:uncharacterized protein M6B38_142585 [Iris pallida]